MKEYNPDRRQFLKSAALSAATIGLSHQAILDRAEDNELVGLSIHTKLPIAGSVDKVIPELVAPLLPLHTHVGIKLRVQIRYPVPQGAEERFAHVYIPIDQNAIRIQSTNLCVQIHIRERSMLRIFATP